MGHLFKIPFDIMCSKRLLGRVIMPRKTVSINWPGKREKWDLGYCSIYCRKSINFIVFKIYASFRLFTFSKLYFKEKLIKTPSHLPVTMPLWKYAVWEWEGCKPSLEMLEADPQKKKKDFETFCFKSMLFESTIFE